MRQYEKDPQALPWTPYQPKNVDYCSGQTIAKTVDLCSIANEYQIECPSSQHTVCVSVHNLNETLGDATAQSTRYASISDRKTVTHYNSLDLSDTDQTAVNGIVDINEPNMIGEHYLAFSTSTDGNCADAMVGVTPQWRVDIAWAPGCDDVQTACAAAIPQWTMTD